MILPNFRQLPLAIAMSLTSTALLAGNEAAPIETITVIAAMIKDSQQAALDAKKLADNYVDIISADTIGRFPDQNLADSLGRLPGLAIERDQGQARYINFRGAPFRYTSIAFDGIDIPGAENGRIPRFDSFPSMITSRIEANKAILASMPGESVAGFINIHTYSPFAKQDWSLVADIGMGEQQLGDGDIEKYGLRLSWSNEQWGFVIFGSENSREQITDNREYDLERDEDTGELIVNELDFRSYKVTREDSAYGGTFEYRGDNTLQRLFLTTIYSEFVDKEQRNQFVFAVNTPQAGVGAHNQAVTVSRLLEYGRYENSTLSNTLGADLQLGQWLLEGRINLTNTEFSMNLPIPRSVGGSTTASYDLSDIEDPKLYLNQALSTLHYAATIGIHYGQQLDIDASKFKLDGERQLHLFKHAATLKTGLQIDQREASGFLATPAIETFPSNINIDSYNTGNSWDSNTSNTIDGSYYDNVGLRNAWQAAGLGSVTATAANSINIEEDIIAIYGMITTEFNWGNIVVGTRIEQTDYASKGTVEGNAISVEDDFTHVLPSIHVNINLTETLMLRVSGSTGINRPTYEEWRAAAKVDVINKEVDGGNPTLDPEEAIGFDSTIEWYFAPASILSAGVFYRSIDNVIYSDTSTIDGGVYLASASGEQWTYKGAVNGDDGKMSGLELNFVGHAIDLIGPALEGFGISVNLTLLDSEFTGIDGSLYDLPGTSNTLYNASVFYENAGFSARLNYQYRDEWISPIEDPNEVWGEQQRVDLSLSYDLPFNVNDATMSVYLNANNLTDETDVRYAANGTINQSESYGRRYLAGIRVNF